MLKDIRKKKMNKDLLTRARKSFYRQNSHQFQLEVMSLLRRNHDQRSGERTPGRIQLGRTVPQTWTKSSGRKAQVSDRNCYFCSVFVRVIDENGRYLDVVTETLCSCF